MASVEPAPAGIIHDLGYQRYTGARLGRRYATLALYTHGLRTAFGFGRSAKAKVFPWMVAGFALVVAIVAVVVRSQTGAVFIGYLQYPDNVAVPVLLFLAVVAPELVSRDLRAQVLPLYFSRPIRRTDYALAKLAALVSAAWLLLTGPELLILLGAVFSQTGGWRGAWHEFTGFLGGVAYAAIMAVVFGSIAVLLASLASRRAVAAAVIVGAFLVTAPVVGVLSVIGGSLRDLAPVLNPVTLVLGVKTALFDPVQGRLDVGIFGPMYVAVAIAVVIGCGTLLAARYRRAGA
jgi:ABC-2 type transport system permease protein